MIDGAYKIEVKVLLGKKEGLVVLVTEGDVVFADIDAPIIGKQQVQGTVVGNRFKASGSGNAGILGRVEYDLKGVVEGDSINIDIRSNKGNVKLNGTRIPL